MQLGTIEKDQGAFHLSFDVSAWKVLRRDSCSLLMMLELLSSFCAWEMSHWWSDTAVSDKGSRNSHFDRMSEGGTPAMRLVSSLGLPVSSVGMVVGMEESRADGDAPGTTSFKNGDDRAGCRQNSIHCWVSGDGPRTRPPILLV